MLGVGVCVAALAHAAPAASNDALPVSGLNKASKSKKAEALLAAYPDQLERIEDNILIWKDGSQMGFDDGVTGKGFEALLTMPDIEDQLAMTYPTGEQMTPPAVNFDPGRFRNDSFFSKMYGDCSKGEVEPNLVTVNWLPSKGGGQVRVTRINGVDKKIKAISDELDALPDRFTPYLVSPGGTYVCRVIAGTNRRSAHAYGTAIDINVPHSDYWRWRKPKADGRFPYHNRIPYEIVRIFEEHGFIWGGKWYHYDTMHFEYRPELLPAAQKPQALPQP